MKILLVIDLRKELIAYAGKFRVSQTDLSLISGGKVGSSEKFGGTRPERPKITF